MHLHIYWNSVILRPCHLGQTIGLVSYELAGSTSRPLLSSHLHQTRSCQIVVGLILPYCTRSSYGARATGSPSAAAASGTSSLGLGTPIRKFWTSLTMVFGGSSSPSA